MAVSRTLALDRARTAGLHFVANRHLFTAYASFCAVGITTCTHTRTARLYMNT